MVSYDQWNHAILSYFVEGVQRGSGVFLSIDEDVIQLIGREFGLTREQSLRSFRFAVLQCVFEGERAKLYRVSGRNSRNEPNGIAFLAAMVLAASYMALEEGTSQSNYFKRLREVLALPQDERRPRPLDMDTGDEEVLWQEWALWLQEVGLLPTAYEGVGSMRYINYPISQALLRRTDKDRLRELFAEKRWGRDLDVESLLAQIHREMPSLPQHLRDLLSSEDQRYRAVAEAIHDFYEDWQDSIQIGQSTTAFSHNAILFSGLFRVEDALRDQVEYFLYPRSPHRYRVDSIQVRFLGELNTLTSERPGWYLPLGPINEKDLDQGAQYLIEQPPGFEALLLPKKRFWILLPDPDDPDSGNYASWGSPALGVPFIILCRKELISQLELLRGEGLIEWSGTPGSLPVNEQWAEVRHCMIILREWSGVHIGDQQLYDALRPRQFLNISVSGGLRAPKVGGWIEGYGPQVTVFGFEAQAQVRIERISNNAVIKNELKQTNQPFTVVWPGFGDYRVEASSVGYTTTRLVKIVPWEQLQITLPDRVEGINIGDWRVCGAYIQKLN
jgi:hypothetical protein